MARREDEDFEEREDNDRPRRRRPRDEDDEDDERPRRRRPRDEDDDEDDDRPRRRRSRDDDEDEDEDDRPRRRVRKRRRPEEEMGWLDQTFANTSMVLLVLFPLCCSVIALVFGIVGVAGCQTSEGKKRALIVLLIAVCTVVFQVIIGILKFHAAVR